LRCVSGSRSLKRLLLVLMIATLQRGGDHLLSAGEGAGAPRSIGHFDGATVFAVSPSGVIYVLLGKTDELLCIEGENVPDRRIGGYGWEEDGFDGPNDLSVPNDLEIYLADYGNDRIVKLDRSLGLSSVFRTTEGGNTFRFPLSVSVTGTGNILIVDGEFGRIVEIDRDNRVSRIFGEKGSGAGSLDRPVRVRTDGDSLVAVQDGSGLVLYDLYGNFLGRLPRTTTGSYLTFAWGGGYVNLLDSTSVKSFSTGGQAAGTVTIPDALIGRVVDLAVVRDVLYLLTPTTVVSFDNSFSRLRK